MEPCVVCAHLTALNILSNQHRLSAADGQLQQRQEQEGCLPLCSLRNDVRTKARNFPTRRELCTACLYACLQKLSEKKQPSIVKKQEPHIVSANTVATWHRLPHECDTMSLQDNGRFHKERKTNKGLILNEAVLYIQAHSQLASLCYCVKLYNDGNLISCQNTNTWTHEDYLLCALWRKSRGCTDQDDTSIQTWWVQGEPSSHTMEHPKLLIWQHLPDSETPKQKFYMVFYRNRIDFGNSITFLEVTFCSVPYTPLTTHSEEIQYPRGHSDVGITSLSIHN